MHLFVANIHLPVNQYLMANVLVVQRPEKKSELFNSAPFYLNCELLFPAQTRISAEGVNEKISKATKGQQALWDAEEQKWKLKYDEGRSVLTIEKAIPVVKAPFGYIPADGHHDILASLKLGASTVPVQVIADFSSLSTEEFWQKAEENGWAYLYAIGGEKTAPIYSFQDLADDPNRRFAGLVGRKYHLNGGSTGAEYPIWIKQDRDIPFIEFRIADVLWSEGLVYTYGEEISIEFIEKARQVLLKSKIERLKIVPTQLHYSQIIVE